MKLLATLLTDPLPSTGHNLFHFITVGFVVINLLIGHSINDELHLTLLFLSLSDLVIINYLQILDQPPLPKRNDYTLEFVPNLWEAVVANPGHLKTPSMKKALSYLIDSVLWCYYFIDTFKYRSFFFVVVSMKHIDR